MNNKYYMIWLLVVLVCAFWFLFVLIFNILSYTDHFHWHEPLQEWYEFIEFNCTNETYPDFNVTNQKEYIVSTEQEYKDLFWAYPSENIFDFEENVYLFAFQWKEGIIVIDNVSYYEDEIIVDIFYKHPEDTKKGDLFDSPYKVIKIQEPYRSISVNSESLYKSF